MTPLPGGGSRPGIFGPSSLAELPRVVRELGLGRVLLVTGRRSFTDSGAADILPEVRRATATEVWSDFSPNLTIEDIVAGSRIARSFRPDGVVAIGGGSVLDMAKLLTAFLGTAPEDIETSVRTNSVTGRVPKLVLVPTTSGSGSEATHFAVAYVGQEKYSVAHPALLPDFVILDPCLTESASQYQKATSGFDAIAQAVESHWARGATAESRAFAHDALEDLIPTVVPHVAGDEEAAVRAARGSYLAGRAIDLTKTTGAHAMAYGLTMRHGVSHGHAVATTLGAFARLHAAGAGSRGANDDLRRDLEMVAGLIGADGADHVGDRLDELAVQLGLELRLSALGVPRSELPTMTRAVNRERLANNPVELSKSELLELLETCW